MLNTSNSTVVGVRLPYQKAPVWPETLSMPDVGKYLGVHPQTARDWVRKGLLPAPAIKVGRIVRWSRGQLEQFVAEGVRR